MTKKIVTTKFNYSIPTDEFKKAMTAAAPGFSTIHGCCWKIWLIEEDRKEAGGVYLFESTGDAEQFLNSYLFASVANNPGFSNLQTNTFDVAEAPSVITGAPLKSLVV